MKYQKGISLPAVILALVVLAFGGVLAAQLVPAYTEASAVKRIVHKIAREAGSKTPDQVRMAWPAANAMGEVTSITEKDLNISRKGNKVVVAYNYSYKKSLVGNISLAIDFVGSSEDPE